MACDFKINEDYILATLSGKVTVADLGALAKFAQEIESTAEPTPHRLTDLSTVEEINLNFISLSDFAVKRRTAKLKNHVKSAIVARTSLHFGFARMFHTLNDNPQITIAIFADLAAAREWVLGEKAP